MLPNYLPAYYTDLLRSQIEPLVGHPLTFIKHILFPKATYLTTLKHNTNEEENFYLIFEFQRDKSNNLSADIRFLQLPESIRRQGLGTKIYYLIENQLKRFGCTKISLDAIINQQDPAKTSIGFWTSVGFRKGLYSFLDEETCPMYKPIKK